MRNCFVPNCDAFCKKNGIHKRMMFSAPKANIVAWKQKLFYKREFRETDRICERHFDGKQIITHWDHVIDGKLCKLERDKPKLEPLAVPYLNLPESPNNASAYVNANKAKTKTKTEQKKRKLTDEKKTDNNNKKPKKLSNDNDIHHEVHTADEGEILNSSSCLVTKVPKRKLTDEEKYQLFDSVYDDVYEIVLPSTLWGIHRDPVHRQYIAFTKFDVNKLNCCKVLSISNDFEMKVSVDGIPKKNQHLDLISVDILTSLLNILDEIV